MSKTIALLVTLDTKDQEAEFLTNEIEASGHKALLMDIGVVGEAGIKASLSREEIIAAGGGSLTEFLQHPTREEANPFVVKGCIDLLGKAIAANQVHAVIGLGGTQGTSTCCNIMQALPLRKVCPAAKII